MNITGNIICRTRYDPSTERSWCEIEKVTGGPYFEIDRRLIEDYKKGDKEIRLGPYRFAVIEENLLANTVICVLKNRRLWRYYKIKHNLHMWLDMIYYRTIRTMQVWNLAYHEPGVIPSWRDIHLVRKFLK